MRQILNRKEPESFTKWVKKNSKKQWSDFSGREPTKEYIELRKSLIKQQDDMCCYCEIALKEDRYAHVEHVKDKHTFPKERFVFDDLYASCQSNKTCGHEKDRKDENKKDNSYFEGMIYPGLDCSKYITFTMTGKVIAKEGDDNTTRTIELLNLNDKKLKNLRLGVIRGLEFLDDNTKKDYLENWINKKKSFYSLANYMQGKSKL